MSNTLISLVMDNHPTIECIDQLVETGLYGADREEVCEQLIRDKLIELYGDGVLKIPA